MGRYGLTPQTSASIFSGWVPSQKTFMLIQGERKKYDKILGMVTERDPNAKVVCYDNTDHPSNFALFYVTDYPLKRIVSQATRWRIKMKLGVYIHRYYSNKTRMRYDLPMMHTDKASNVLYYDDGIIVKTQGRKTAIEDRDSGFTIDASQATQAVVFPTPLSTGKLDKFNHLNSKGLIFLP